MYIQVFLKYLVINATVFRSSNPTELTAHILSGDDDFLTIETKAIEINYNNVRQLAIMSYDVYYERDGTEWIDVELNNTIDTSQSHENIHAYIFSNDDMSVNVVAFKGTSVYWDTNTRVNNDKYNDNLLFSCCFYEESSLFGKDACSCSGSSQQECCKHCYETSVNLQRNYIGVAETIMEKVQTLFDVTTTSLMFTGHSLGGALATMMGVKYDKQVVTFESPGEKHYLDLIGWRYEHVTNKVYHFGHDADIIFTGKCNGVWSWCALGGYNMKTKCHIGKVCQYNTVERLKMKESIFTHKIKFVLENVIERWNDSIPECVEQSECRDCQDWNYI